VSSPADSPPALPPALRREQLLVRSTVLRLQLAREAQVLEAPLAIADKVHLGLRWLWQHPEWPVAGLVVLVVLRPRRAWRWATRAWWAWRLWRRSGRLLLGDVVRR